MRSIAIVVVLAGCSQLLTTQDSTDVEGTYVGNATYTIALGGGSGMIDAGSVSIDVTAGTDTAYSVAIGDACALSASAIETLSINDYINDGRFVFDSDSIDGMQSCMLPDGVAITVALGDFVVEHGGAMTLEVGGPLAGGSGYAVFQFAGAL